MLEMIRAPHELRERWGAAARLRIEREFGEGIVAERYLAAIEDAFA
jgi:hypothetical protein